MKKLSIKLIITLLTFIIGISAWLYYLESQRIQILTPESRWQTIYFKPINKITNLVGLKELRNTVLSKGDLEIRVWRGGSLEPLEGVILKQTSGKWSAFHIKTDNYYDPEKAELKELEQPKSGWESFWEQLARREILTLPESSDEDCVIPTLDQGGYIVEINRNRTYRTYHYPEGNAKCREAELIEEIGEVIGEEFDSGNEECKSAEWFPCTKLRKSYKQNKP